MVPSTAKSTKLSLSGVISVSAIECASLVRWVSDAGGIDDDEIVGLLDGGERVDEAGEFDRLVVVELLSRAARDAVMLRRGKRAAGVLGPDAPVLDVLGEALLPQIEIDGGDPLPEIHQGDGDMHGERRLSCTALLIAEHYDMRGFPPHPARLHQHHLTSRQIISHHLVHAS